MRDTKDRDATYLKLSPGAKHIVDVLDAVKKRERLQLLAEVGQLYCLKCGDDIHGDSKCWNCVESGSDYDSLPDFD